MYAADPGTRISLGQYFVQLQQATAMYIHKCINAMLTVLNLNCQFKGTWSFLKLVLLSETIMNFGLIPVSPTSADDVSPRLTLIQPTTTQIEVTLYLLPQFQQGHPFLFQICRDRISGNAESQNKKKSNMIMSKFLDLGSYISVSPYSWLHYCHFSLGCILNSPSIVSLLSRSEFQRTLEPVSCR